ncbi:MAG TPA: macro domain-containing protein [Nitrospiraceae bacterium]|nr:macro domain-containing protein [Nitrospiraceae bacterium]
MDELVKQIFSEPKSIILVLFAALLSIAILGVVPTSGDPIELTLVQRLMFASFALAFLIIGVFFLSKSKTTNPPIDEEYKQKFRETNEGLSTIVPEDDILAASIDSHGPRVTVLNSNITSATTDIIVSSDDNWLSAKGGVAKAIVTKAGLEVAGELERHRRYKRKLRQGEIAITTGGLTGARAIFHPAIIDLDQNRYPNQSLIRKVVRRSLVCAMALGAESIAFPILGGGTASRNLTAWDSIQAILGEIQTVMRNPSISAEGRLTYVAVYVFNRNDIKGDIKTLVN